MGAHAPNEIKEIRNATALQIQAEQAQQRQTIPLQHQAHQGPEHAGRANARRDPALTTAMPCYNPLTAYQLDGEIHFDHRRDGNNIQLPCGQCIGCRLERSRRWATRCMHEAQLHKHNEFVTLTYNDEHLPKNKSLNHRDFQLFMKRLRRSTGQNVRYYMAGEYGDQFGRPHFHAAIFNLQLLDRKYLRTTAAKAKIYTSEKLQKIWGKGYASTGDVTFESAAYIARYIVKKVTGRNAKDHYTRLGLETGEIYQIQPEYNRMSLRPAIGKNWLKKYHQEVYPEGKVLVRGHLTNAPRYYDEQYASWNDDTNYELDQLRYQRHLDGVLRAHDNTPQRLAAKEAVATARAALLKRTIN